MTDVIIVGTIGLDTIETPFGKVENILGGSATYASLASNLFASTGIVSIAGDDLPEEHTSFLKDKGINLDGVEIKGKTFRWQGFYEFDMNEAKTLRTELNALEIFDPKVPESYAKAKNLFLGNIDPGLQAKVISQLDSPECILIDTMNFWIEHKPKEVINAMKQATIIVMNDGEARQLFETTNLKRAASRALELGPEAVIIKKGEHGALMFTPDKHFNAPSYPLEDVKDPTGCGDSFGGGLIGYLAKTNDYSESNLRKAVIYGSVIASHNAESFGTENLKDLTIDDVEARFSEIRAMREF